MVRTIFDEDHKCDKVVINLKVTSGSVAKILYFVIKNNPGIGTFRISEELRIRYGTATTKRKLYAAKKRALKLAM